MLSAHSVKIQLYNTVYIHLSTYVYVCVCPSLYSSLFPHLPFVSVSIYQFMNKSVDQSVDVPIYPGAEQNMQGYAAESGGADFPRL